MKYDRYKVMLLDADGDEMSYPRDFTSKKEARKTALELAAEPRSYFVQKGESEIYADNVQSVGLFDGDDLIEEFSLKFKS